MYSGIWPPHRSRQCGYDNIVAADDYQRFSDDCGSALAMAPCLRKCCQAGKLFMRQNPRYIASWLLWSNTVCCALDKAMRALDTSAFACDESTPGFKPFFSPRHYYLLQIERSGPDYPAALLLTAVRQAGQGRPRQLRRPGAEIAPGLRSVSITVHSLLAAPLLFQPSDQKQRNPSSHLPGIARRNRHSNSGLPMWGRMKPRPGLYSHTPGQTGCSPYRSPAWPEKA